MEPKKDIKLWHRAVALLVGYVAAGITFELLPIILAYPFGMLHARTQSELFSFDVTKGLATIAAIAMWIAVYVYCVRNWWNGRPPPDASAPQ
jgi:hypothetical protein